MFSITFNAQIAESVTIPNNELLLGKWIARKLTHTNPANPTIKHTLEVGDLNNYFYEFKSDGSYIGNPLEGKQQGTWKLSENKKITLNSFDPAAKRKKETIFEYTIVTLNEKELLLKSVSKSGIFEYTMAKFDPNHKHGTVKFKFYNTYEDIAKDKFITSYDVVSWSDSDFSYENIKFINAEGKEEKLKVTNYPSDFMKLGDDKLYRRYKNETYSILIAGAFSYYGAGYDLNPERYSETINGPIKKLTSGILEDKLKEYGLLEAYRKDKPKREIRDGVQSYFEKEVARNIKYINLLNKALSKK
jgi:hypothetical protein